MSDDYAHYGYSAGNIQYPDQPSQLPNFGHTVPADGQQFTTPAASSRAPVNMAPSRNHLASSAGLASWGSPALLSSPSPAADAPHSRLFSEGPADTNLRIPGQVPVPQSFVEEVALKFGVDGDYRKVLLDEVQAISGDSSLSMRVKRSKIATFASLCGLHRKMDLVLTQTRNIDELADLQDEIKEQRKASAIKLEKGDNKEIRRLVHNVVFQKDFYDLHNLPTVVMRKIREKPEQYGLKTYLGEGSAARDAEVQSVVSKLISGALNVLQDDLKKATSLTGSKKETLTRYVIEAARRYKKGGIGENLEYAYTIKVALWRHFTIHNAVGLSAESEGAGPALDHSQTEPATKRPKLGEGPVVIKDHLGKEVTLPPKPASGFFWRTFQWWFNCLCAEHGPPFNTESWKMFINKIVDLDNATYDPTRPRISIHSPQTPLSDGGSTVNQAAGSGSS